jgi:hypothetical protein
MFTQYVRVAFPLALFDLVRAVPAAADTFFFSTGNPDGLIATASRPASAGKLEIESADDFVLTGETAITSATFTGLLPTGAPLSDVSDVVVEIYRVFPTTRILSEPHKLRRGPILPRMSKSQIAIRRVAA